MLNALPAHMDDKHLHVIASPGSGKTVLGLEVVCRLSKPALILAPTLTIRDQWVQRFCEHFLPDGEPCPDWITTNIREPGLITVSTYQALHCAHTGELDNGCEVDTEDGEVDDEPEEASGEVQGVAGGLVAALKSAGVNTLVLDEAHHLRTNWWKSLTSVKKDLGDLSVVALTATPPYDVSVLEWERYRELCGPVDEEICAPELVLDGNLCPHQDFVYFNAPSRDESDRLKQFHDEAESLRRDLCINEEFVSALEAHPWVENPKAHVEEILSDPEYFSSIAIFINHVRGRTPGQLLDVLGVSNEKIPPLNYEWFEVLLTRRLFLDEQHGLQIDPILKEIKDRLDRIGAVERRRVYLASTPRLDKMLTTSVQKLESILEIVKIEQESLGDDLRMVILADYIRKSEMPSGPDDIKPLHKLGVVPIFERIRRNYSKKIKLGILSGTLAVIPTESAERLREICREEKIDLSRVLIQALGHDNTYSELSIDGGDTVKVVTRLFSEGGITCLVGTKSLLGEGWDAPCVNALILASFVGSFMLSNQMRGRAVRSIPGSPDKTANVWHIVCVDPGSHSASADLATLRRRFKAFVGVSRDGESIENGIERLGIGKPPFTIERIDEINASMTLSANDRAGLRERWKNALYNPQNMMRLVNVVSAPQELLPRKYVFENSAVAGLWQAASWGGFLYSQIRGGLVWTSGWTDDLSPFRMSAIALFFAGAITAPQFVKMVRLLIKHGPIDWSIRQIGLALAKTLTWAGIIKTDFDKLIITAERDPKAKTVTCTINGCATYEQSVFLDALQEILEPVKDPRYLLVRWMIFGNHRTKDIHAVPYLIGQRKEYAEHFSLMWERYVGSNNLVFTRNIAGRRVLLQARASSMAAAFQPESERISCWK